MRNNRYTFPELIKIRFGTRKKREINVIKYSIRVVLYVGCYTPIEFQKAL